VDGGLNNASVYTYVVFAVGPGGYSAYSSAATAGATPQLNAYAGVNLVALSWSPSAGATGYTLSRSTTATGGFQSIYTGAASTRTYTDSTAQNGTTYYYQLVATGGTSAPYNQVSATPNSGAKQNYYVTSYSGGVPSYTPMIGGSVKPYSTPFQYQAALDQFTIPGFYGTYFGPVTGPVSLSGALSATCTWVGPASPPDYANVEIDLATWAQCGSYLGGTLTTADGFGDPMYSDPFYSWCGGFPYVHGNGTILGAEPTTVHHRLVENPGAVFTLPDVSPSVSIIDGDNTVGHFNGDYGYIALGETATAASISISQVGATPVKTDLIIAPGQQITFTSTIQGVQPGGAYSWTITGGGAPYKDYVANPTYAFQTQLQPSDYAGANFTCYFGAAPDQGHPLVITCTYTDTSVNPPIVIKCKQPITLTVEDPAWSNQVSSIGTMQLLIQTGAQTFIPYVQGGASPTRLQLWGAQDTTVNPSSTWGIWEVDTVGDPPNIVQGSSTGTTPGNWCHVQTVNPIAWQNTWSGGVYNLQFTSALDSMQYPAGLGAFPYDQLYTTSGAGQQGKFADAPWVGVQNTVGDQFSGTFDTYVFYQPPSYGQPTTYVPIRQDFWIVTTSTVAAPGPTNANWTQPHPGTVSLETPKSAQPTVPITIYPPFPQWQGPAQNVAASSGVASITLTWGTPVQTNSSYTYTYNVLRSTTQGHGYVPVANGTGLSAMTFTDTVGAGTQYYYVITVTCRFAPGATGIFTGDHSLEVTASAN
jgi:hypothetical protein